MVAEPGEEGNGKGGRRPWRSSRARARERQGRGEDDRERKRMREREQGVLVASPSDLLIDRRKQEVAVLASSPATQVLEVEEEFFLQRTPWDL
jgi:hypothetical protein